MQSGQTDFLLHYSNCAVCRYSGATKGTFIQQGGSASATRAGAGAGPRPGQAHISARRGRPRPKTGRARAGRRGADQPAQTAGARCRRRPCPRPHPGPACWWLIHAHCPLVCNALASADDLHAAVCTALFEALTAPGNLLQGKIKNQT